MTLWDISRKRCGHSVGGLDDDLVCPAGICVSARVPVRALDVLVQRSAFLTAQEVPLLAQSANVSTVSCSVFCQEAHEQGINAVRFSSTSDLLATGGTDRVVKLWDVRAGTFLFCTSLRFWSCDGVF